MAAVCIAQLQPTLSGPGPLWLTNALETGTASPRDAAWRWAMVSALLLDAHRHLPLAGHWQGLKHATQLYGVHACRPNSTAADAVHVAKAIGAACSKCWNYFIAALHDKKPTPPLNPNLHRALCSAALARIDKLRTAALHIARLV